MPVKPAKRGKKWRVVEASSGNVAKNRADTAIDGGGYATRAKALAQARAVNSRGRKK